MQFLDETIDIRKIETTTMYKMIQSLLSYNFFYETKCLVNIFLEKRTDIKELETLNKIIELLYNDKTLEIKQILNTLIK